MNQPFYKYASNLIGPEPSFGDNVKRAIPDVIGQALGGVLGGKISSEIRKGKIEKWANSELLPDSVRGSESTLKFVETVVRAGFGYGDFKNAIGQEGFVEFLLGHQQFELAKTESSSLPKSDQQLYEDSTPIELAGARRDDAFDFSFDNPITTAGREIFAELERRRQEFRQKLENLPADAANEFANSMRGRHARDITSGEKTILADVFGNGIDLSDVRIVNGAGWNPDAAIAIYFNGNPAITEGDTVYINPEKDKNGDYKYYSADLSTTSGNRELLVHVRQYQQMGFGNFFGRYASELVAHKGDAGSLYAYENRNTTWGTETLEGQAQMAGEYAQKRIDGAPTTAPDMLILQQRLAGSGIYGL